MKQYKKLFKIFIVSLLLFSAPLLALRVPVDAAGTASLSVSPSSGSYTVGKTFSIVVSEDSGDTPVNAVEVDMVYDKSLLEFVKSEASSNFTGSNAMVMVNSGGDGLTCFTGARLGEANALTDKKEVTTITFKVKKAGTATLTFIKDSSECYSGSTGTAILALSDQQNVWNNQTSAGSFSLKAVVSDSDSSDASTGSNTTTSNSNQSTTQTDKTDSSSSVDKTTKTNNNESKKTGFMVAILVTDENNNPIPEVEVFIDDEQSAVTDETGIASFANVQAGEHTIKTTVNGVPVSSTINVKGASTTAVEEFNLHTNAASGSSQRSIATYFYIFGGIVVITVAGLIIWDRFKKPRFGRSTNNVSAPGVFINNPPAKPDNSSAFDNSIITSGLSNAASSGSQLPGSVVKPDQTNSQFNPADNEDSANKTIPGQGI